jgi:hypothetical protein
MPTRRTFLQAAAVASAGAFAPMSHAAPQRYKMGLQLYTIRDAMARDVAGTLKRVAALGYQEVETYGFDPRASAITGCRRATSRNDCGTTG